MEKISKSCMRRIAIRQAKSNLHLWMAGAASSAILVGISLCLSLQESGWHIALILICACIGLYLIGRKTVCSDSVCTQTLEAAGATVEQIRIIMRYQMTGLLAVSVPAGLALGAAVRPFLPW